MTDKIQPLFPGQPVPGAVNDNAVQLLEHMLNRAKSGEIRDVAIAAWTSDSAALSGFTPDSPVPLLGALMRLIGRVERTMQEGE